MKRLNDLSKIKNNERKFMSPKLPKNIFSMLNPLEPIARSIEAICEYKVKMNELDVQKKQIEATGWIRLEQIAVSKEISLKRLDYEYKLVEKAMNTAIAELTDSRENRKEMFKLMSNLNDRICSNDVDIEEKKVLVNFSNDILTEINESSRNSGRRIDMMNQKTDSLNKLEFDECRYLNE